MNAAQLSQSVVLQKLRDLYALVIDHRDAVLAGDEALAADKVQAELIAFMEAQLGANEGIRDDSAHQITEQVRYVMVALTDDIMVNLEVDSLFRTDWRAHPLENELYGTQKAGNEFFSRLEGISAAQEPEIAAAYLIALLLGFKGQYRGSDEGTLRRKRDQQFALLFAGQPSVSDQKRQLFPDAYANTVTTEPTIAMPDPKRYLRWLAYAFVAHIVIAHAVWYVQTIEVRTVASKVMARTGD